MKKALFMSICASSLLFLSACSLVRATTSPLKPVPENLPASSPAALTSPADEQGQDTSLAAARGPEKQILTPQSFQAVNKIFNARDGANWYCYAAAPELTVRGEAAQQYPGLVTVIDGINNKTLAEAGSLNDKMSQTLAEVWADQQTKKEVPPDYFFCNYMEAAYSVIRADDQAVSLQKFANTYLGGTHGDYSIVSYNIDPQNGKMLFLAEVARDLKTLENYLVTALPKQYPDASLFDHEKTIHSLFAKAAQNDLDGRILEEHWTLTNTGIAFHFNPYEVASYADGLLTVDIEYAAHPELFAETAAQRLFVPNARKSVAVPLRSEHFSELLGKWHLVSLEIEGDVMDAKASGIDSTLEIGNDGYAHYVYNQGDNHDDFSGLKVKVEDNAMYDGCVTNWCAALLNDSPKREFYVTVLPDGTLRFMSFSYIKGAEYPAVMMGTFKRS
ncbi:MAG: RsiV family protein [bacterium]|nr:RsiV family protein [bacterium]